MSTTPPHNSDWHALDLPSLFGQLQARETGLTQTEAQARLKTYGPNELPRQPAPTWWQVLLGQFLSPLIYVLIFAAGLSLLIGNVTDAAFIAFVISLNAAIGGYQEWRAEQSTRALQQLLRIRASVVRDGEVCEIVAEEVVPGDVVWLESGNRVPADIRMLATTGLEVDESLLTGESLAVLKDSRWTGEAETPIADRRNLVYAGSAVVRGRGKGIVFATGTHTFVGQLALDVMSATGGKPPLLVRMERFNRIVAIAILGAAILIALIGILGQGHPIKEMMFFAIALAVAAIPEGLPAALTVALAVAATRMARRKVIVRRLAAVEGLGSCTLIASDKTGTLTCNELSVREVRLPDGTQFDVTGEGFAPHGEVFFQGQPVAPHTNSGLDALACGAVLCNEGDLHHSNGGGGSGVGWVWRGDPTDLALLSFAHKLGWNREAALDRYPQVNQIPFEPERQFAASYHQLNGDIRVYVKGAPERVLSMCDWENESGVPRLHMTTEKMAAQGYRVLALAEGHAPAHPDASLIPPEQMQLRFLGFVGMIDPLRSGVREAVETCHRAGITVCMVTGDHPVTALAIARDLGLATKQEQVITGRELEEKSERELQEIIQHVRVFARVAPHQKLQLVNAARQAGHFVAVTGDGVNDAPALRAANIGVAMGRGGTDVARDASDLVISNDNFATIVAGIEEGRVAYDNVRKAIYFLISFGAAELVALGAGVAMGLPLLLLPMQILWLNVITNGIQGVALAFEPNEGGVLRRKAKPPDESIFNRLMNERTIIAALVIGGLSLGAFYWMLHAGWSVDAARNVLLLLMVLFGNVHIGNSRSETKSAFVLSPFRTPVLLGGVSLALLLHAAAMHLPLGQRVLKIEPVSVKVWAMLLALSISSIIVIEIHKLIWKMRQRD